jgi:hypothetical protein
MPTFRRRTPQPTGIPLQLAELDDGELKDLRHQFRSSATHLGRPDAWRQVFYFLVELVDEERGRRLAAKDAPEQEPTPEGETSSSLAQFLLKRVDDN